MNKQKNICVAVWFDDTGGGGDRDEGPVIIKFWTYRYRYRKGCCQGNRDCCIDKQWSKGRGYYPC